MTAKCCTNVLLGIEEARHYFNAAKCIVTGTPVRQEMAVRKNRREARAELNLPQDRRVVLVMGGSQGARNLNSLVIEAARQCAELCDFLIITGAADFARVSQLTADMPHVHVIEFCSAMAACAAADVVISRSGASSLTELAHMGKAALLVPTPSPQTITRHTTHAFSRPTARRA
ncbi:MAG: UDP-N-acetylglucosamine--N-acetylmuramyl-(pentapeptide) pyrophosphoryl-undecaprenol N-acetylglucosamine transferase [Akkermansia sp.]